MRAASAPPRPRRRPVALFKFLERRGEVGQVVGAEFLPPLAKQLEFDNVSLREPGIGRMLLEDVTLTIPAGQRIGLVGAGRPGEARAGLPDPALARPDLRRDPHRPAQPALGDARLAARPDRHGAAAQPGLQRHGGQQHRLRRPAVHAAADHRGGQDRPRPPLHPEAAAGLRDAHRRAGPLPAASASSSASPWPGPSCATRPCSSSRSRSSRWTTTPRRCSTTRWRASCRAGRRSSCRTASRRSARATVFTCCTTAAFRRRVSTANCSPAIRCTGTCITLSLQKWQSRQESVARSP